jgi:CRP-like cAMP-binding protein
MRRKVAALVVLAFTTLMFGLLGANAFAADKVEGLELSKALAQVKLMAGLTEAEREALKVAATLRHGQAGELIVQQGKEMGRMVIILRGKAEVRISGKLVVTLSGQSLVGEIEFLDTLPASADVVLLEEADLIELNSAALNLLMEKQPRVGYVLMREIAKIEAGRLRRTNLN